MKKLFIILFAVILAFAAVACAGVNEPKPSPSAGAELKSPHADEQGGNTGKTFEFPKREFVPDWAVFTGEGTYVLTNSGNPSGKITGMTWIDGAKLEDVQAYIKTLKQNGLEASEFTDEEPDSTGAMIWYGMNADKSFTVFVSYTSEDAEIEDSIYGTGKHSYNLQIQVSNNDYMN